MGPELNAIIAISGVVGAGVSAWMGVKLAVERVTTKLDAAREDIVEMKLKQKEEVTRLEHKINRLEDKLDRVIK